jgi:hypothetical protein
VGGEKTEQNQDRELEKEEHVAKKEDRAEKNFPLTIDMVLDTLFNYYEYISSSVMWRK